MELRQRGELRGFALGHTMTIDESFLEACGAGKPIELEWQLESTSEVNRYRSNRPAILVGRGPEADLVIDHPEISLRHAYLQVVDGRLIVIDLESRNGLLWDDIPRPAGWLDLGGSVEVGPALLRLAAPIAEDPIESTPGPNPLTSRYVSHRPVPQVLAEVDPGEGPTRRIPMDRRVVLVGRSERCHLQLDEPDASRFVCALVNTPVGVWVVDLLSHRGFRINGAATRTCRVVDGDVMEVGKSRIHFIYEDWQQSSLGGSAPAALANPVLVRPTVGEGCGEPLEAFLRPMLTELATGVDTTGAPFGQALLMLINLVSEVHRDQLALVREELQHIRRLTREMQWMRSQSTETTALEDGRDTEEPRPAGTGSWSGREGHPLGSLGDPLERVEPWMAQALASERLAAWERERQSRWRKVLDLLGKS